MTIPTHYQNGNTTTPSNLNPAFQFFVWTSLLRKCSALNNTSLSVGLVLAFHANKDGICWPSIPTLGKGTRLCERTVKTQIKLLSDLGWIKIYKCPGHTKSNHYRLTYPQPQEADALVIQAGNIKPDNGGGCPPTVAPHAPTVNIQLPLNCSKNPLSLTVKLGEGEDEQPLPHDEAAERFAYLREQLTNGLRTPDANRRAA